MALPSSVSPATMSAFGVHIAAGTLALLAGLVALSAAKGGTIHRRSGAIFVLAMLTMAAAADYLYDANMPLVYGLSNITCEAQREAVSLAELIGGVIDSHTSL